MFYSLIEIMKSESGTRIIADILVGLLPSVCEFYFSKLVILLLFNVLYEVLRNIPCIHLLLVRNLDSCMK